MNHPTRAIRPESINLLLRLLLGFVLSALLLVMAMPPVDYSALVWICLVPLFWSVAKTRFLVGFVAGLIMPICAAWIGSAFFYSSAPDGPTDTSWIYTGFALFGLPIAFVSGAWAERKTHRVATLVGLACLAVLLEASLMLILPVHLALPLYRSMLAMEIASYGAIWAVSFILWFASLLVAAALLRGGKRSLFAAAATGVCMLIFSQTSNGDDKGGFLVAAVQTMESGLEELAALNRREPYVDLVVWPELSAVGIVSFGDTSPLQELARQEGQPPFVTSFRDTAMPLNHNTAALFSPAGMSATYFKRKPFAGEKQIHAAGSDPVVVRLSQSRKVGLNICFDSCFPYVIRETVLEGRPDVIALPTLDPASLGYASEAVHAAYTTFRAAEVGVAIVRAEAGAHSMIVGTEGEIHTRVGAGEAFIMHNVDEPHATFYLWAGDWVLYGSGLYLLIFLGTTIARRQRSLAGHRTQEVPASET